MNHTVQRILLGMVFILAGVNHFLRPQFYEAIMPNYLPKHRLLVLLSGVAEVFGGVLALFGRTQQLARWSLLVTLVGVFPANLHMALHPERYAMLPSWLLWLRLPLQGGLIWWVWWATDGQED